MITGLTISLNMPNLIAGEFSWLLPCLSNFSIPFKSSAVWWVLEANVFVNLETRFVVSDCFQY